MEDAKSIRTPVDTSTKLIKGGNEDTSVDQQLYQSAVGSLLYLSVATRPDITYAVSNVARFCAKPTNQHWVAVKCIFRYLKGTQQYGLLYSKSILTTVWDFQMLIGEVIWMIESQLLDICFRLEGQL